MMYLNKFALVVEGTNDVSYLSSFITGEIVSVNGLEVKKDTIGYLQELQKVKKIIIMCDPDEVGEKITNSIKEKLTNYEVVRINKERCNRGSKNGVAECDKEEILSKLKPFLQEKCIENTQSITLSDIEKLKSKYSVSNIDLCELYHLGKVNSKTMIRRLTALGLGLETIDNQLAKKYGNK